jgi:hypothetical protein
MQNTVPPAWVADLFRRFAVLYGAQRMAVMYPDEALAETVSVWSAELAKHPREAVAGAITELPRRERAWPPTLPEFLALVAECKPAPEHRRALPVPRRTADEIARGRERMDAIKALVGRRPAAASRVPGEDDEPPPPPPACTCWTGLKRAEVLCEACAGFRRSRARMDALRDGTAEEMVRQVRDAA